MSDGEPIDPNQAQHAYALAKGTRLCGGSIEVDRFLEKGGFGMVYQVHHVGFSKPMVIKEYLPTEIAMRDHNTKSVLPTYTSGDKKEAFDQGLKMFLDEAKILREFDHKNIVKAEKYFEENNTAYMELEYIKGETLADKLKREGRLKEQALKDILAGVLDGLAYVHDKKHLHRDISPDNIMIREDGTPVLIDFGIARTKFGTAVPESRMGVKAGYSPIEQRGQAGGIDMKMEYGPGTDIYALSVVAYQALGGELPMDWIPRSARLGSGPDPMVPAVEALRGLAHENFLKAIDWGLQIKLQDRPKSVAAFRKMLFAEDVQEPDVQNQIDRNPTDMIIKGEDGPQKPREKPKSPTEPSPHGRGKAAIIGLVIALIALPALSSGYGYYKYRQYQNNDLIAWQNAERNNTISAYQNYIGGFTFGSYHDQAKAKIKAFQYGTNDQASWEKAKQTNTIEAYQDYLNTHLSGSYRSQAKARIEELATAEKALLDEKAWQEAQRANTIEAYQDYLDTYPSGSYWRQAQAGVKKRKVIEKESLQRAEEDKLILEPFLNNHGFANIDAIDKIGRTPLHWAAREGEYKVAALLIQRGAKVNALDGDGLTPLHRAVWKGEYRVAALLIQKGAKVNTLDGQNFTPLHTAVWKGEDRVATLLIQKGAEVNTLDGDGYTPLHGAAIKGNYEIAALLIENGANVKARDELGRTPLHTAAWKDEDRVATLLIQKGADVKARDKSGDTPLHTAAWKGNHGIAALLIENGAKVNARNNRGNTPLYYAEREEYWDTAAIIVRAGGKK